MPVYSVNLVPAYGRDYKSPDEVLKDWNACKDFLIRDIGNAYDGKYTSKDDWIGKAVRIRFNRLADFVIIENDKIAD